MFEFLKCESGSPLKSGSHKQIFITFFLMTMSSWFIVLYLKQNGMHLIPLNNIFKDIVSYKWDNCKPILEEGNFLEVDNCTNNDPATYNGTDINCIRRWKPKGCNLHYYSVEDSRKCFKSISLNKKSLLFVGDSRMRYLYNKIVKNFANINLPMIYKEDHHVFENETKTNMTYLFSKYMDKMFIKTTKEIEEYLPEEGVSVVVFGVTLHMMILYKKRKSEEGLKTFHNYLTQAKNNIDAIGKKAIVLWFFQSARSKSLKIVERMLKRRVPERFVSNKMNKSKIPKNIYAKMLKISRQMKEDYERFYKQMALIPTYNKMAEKILKGTSAKMWYSAKDIGENSLDDYLDSTHLPDYDNYNFLQIIINMVCNRFLKLSLDHCCST